MKSIFIKKILSNVNYDIELALKMQHYVRRNFLRNMYLMSHNTITFFADKKPNFLRLIYASFI